MNNNSKKREKLSTSKCLGASKDLYNRGPDYLKYNFYNNRTLFVLNDVFEMKKVLSKFNIY